MELSKSSSAIMLRTSLGKLARDGGLAAIASTDALG
jgi:hypothetical protein